MRVFVVDCVMGSPEASMTPRADLVTASRVDLTLILLPLIGQWEAAWTLAANEVPLDVAARVLALPLERRPTLQPAFLG